MPDSKGNTVKSLLSSSPEENLPMATMKSVQTGNQNKVDVVDIERPVPGPKDALVRIRACGICGTDVSFLHMGGIPFGPGGSMISLPLGHEPAGEIVEVGSEVRGLKVGDRVVVNPQAAPSGIIGCGGKLGGMRDYLLIEDAVLGASVAVFPDTVPFDVAALNEPMAVARHCVNRSQAKPTDKVVVQKKSDSIDLGGMLRSELTLIASQGYPTEIFEVTPEIVEQQDRFAKLISHRVPFSEVERAFELALTPGAAEKVIVTFDDQP